MPSRKDHYFFCGIGCSGMLPLALILKGQGAEISGSDRSHDQGRTPDKFRYIQSQGMKLYPQDGSGLQDGMVLVVSSAIENSIPEVAKAKERTIPIVKRAELLAGLFNRAETRIAVAGTSGKSTTTGMIGYVLHETGKNPTVMNGAVFRNFADEKNPYATALSGDPALFVTEADESDGSIELYNPTIAVLNNISLDHKSMDELRQLFSRFVEKAGAAVLNLDNDEVAALSSIGRNNTTYSLYNRDADLYAAGIVPLQNGIECSVYYKGAAFPLKLNVPGRHNLSNALACLATLAVLGADIGRACEILSGFSGVRRRAEIVGQKRGITVIDDFAHNPDKIEATLQTLKEFPGRLLIMFQMHGFGPLKLMHRELAESFAKHLTEEDGIFMPEVLYLGGTAARDYTARDFVDLLNSKELNANWFETRDEITRAILDVAEDGDRIVIMGARDDTLSDFARGIVRGL